jgi:hypothetical protein
MHPDPQRLARVHELSRPEHLLVWALRAICIGHGDCPLLARTFVHACGPDGPQTLAAYQALVMTVGVASRRRLQVHVPGCACVSPDERAMVAAVSAAQRSLAGDEAPLRGALAALAGREPPEELVFAAQVVGRALQAGGHVLPGPRGSLAPPSSALH